MTELGNPEEPAVRTEKGEKLCKAEHRKNLPGTESMERSKKVLSDTEEKLKVERNWEKGLVTIVESMARLGFDRCSIFLVNRLRNTLNSYLSKGVYPPDSVSISLKDARCAGAQCICEKKTIHKDCNREKGDQPTPESEFSVWVPLMVCKKPFGALAAGNKNPMTKKEVKALEILADTGAAFFERTKIVIEPIPEKTLKTKCKNWLNPSEIYIFVEKDPEKSLTMFCDIVTHGIPGVAVSRIHPENLRRKYKLMQTPMVWLSQSWDENTTSPDDLLKLNYMIGEFIEKSTESVVLLVGLEDLIAQMNFEKVLMYLQELKDLIAINNSRLIIPLEKGILSLREYSLLEREFMVLESM